GPRKLRDESETVVARADEAQRILGALGFAPRFRYQKFREELSLDGLIVAIDETPVGTFVELEGDEPTITAVAARLGRGPADYVLASYRSLFLEHRQATGGHGAHMVFQETALRRPPRAGPPTRWSSPPASAAACIRSPSSGPSPRCRS